MLYILYIVGEAAISGYQVFKVYIHFLLHSLRFKVVSALLFAEPQTLWLVLALRIRIKLVVRNPEACGQACVVHLEVFQLYLQVPFVMHVLLRQEDGVAVVASLTQNLDGDLHVKVDFALAALLKHIAGRQQVHNMAMLSFTKKKGTLCTFSSGQPP